MTGHAAVFEQQGTDPCIQIVSGMVGNNFYAVLLKQLVDVTGYRGFSVGSGYGNDGTVYGESADTAVPGQMPENTAR